MRKPNILLVCADMASAEHFGCYGNPAGITPNIDGIAARGTLFEQAYCPCPPCIPARASMMSGLYGHTHGKIAHLKMRLTPRPQLIPEILSRNGYRTGLVGKTHWWPSADSLGCNDAFLTIDDHLTPELGKNDAYIRYLEAEGLFAYDEKTWEQEKEHLHPDRLPFESLKVNWTARQTCKLLEEYSAARDPFFLFCSFVEPHGSRKAPKQYLEKMQQISLPAIIGRSGEHNDKPDVQRRAVKGWAAKPQKKEAYRRGVYAGIGLVDQCIGTILETFQKLNLSENTVVLLLTDHGDLMYDHGCVEKTFLYEQAIRIPLLIAGPGIPSGARRSHLVSQIDLLPTILDLCSIDVDSLRVDGRSVLPIISDPKSPWRDKLFAEVDQTVHLKDLVSASQAKMIRQGPWKYIYTLIDGHRVEEELYNLEEDPQELHNIAGRPAQADRTQKLRSEILRWMVATEVRRLHPEPENHYQVPSINTDFL